MQSSVLRLSATPTANTLRDAVDSARGMLRSASPPVGRAATPTLAGAFAIPQVLDEFEPVRPESSRPDPGWEWMGLADYAAIDSAIRAPITAVTNAAAKRVPYARAIPWGAVGKSILRDTGALGVFDAAAKTAGDVYHTPTEDYYRRYGFDPNNPGLAKDLAVRTLGATSDFGARVADHIPGVGDVRRFYRDYQE